MISGMTSKKADFYRNEPKVEPEAAKDIIQLKPQQELNAIEHT